MKDIPGHEDRYAATEDGQIWSHLSGKFLKQFANPRKYWFVGLRVDGKQIKKSVARIIGKTFIPNPENKPEINHKDGNKNNNRSDNLEWATHSENNLHAYRIGLKTTRPHPHGTGSYSRESKRKLNDEQVRQIRSLYREGKHRGPALSKMFNTPGRTIYDILEGKKYKDIV